MADVPQFALPFRVVGGAVVEVEQDSVEEIEACVEAVLRTIVGTRLLDDPDFGIPDESFVQQTPSPSAAVYVAAIEEQEPRARVLGKARLLEMAEKHVTIEPRESGV